MHYNPRVGAAHTQDTILRQTMRAAILHIVGKTPDGTGALYGMILKNVSWVHRGKTLTRKKNLQQLQQKKKFSTGPEYDGTNHI